MKFLDQLQSDRAVLAHLETAYSRNTGRDYYYLSSVQTNTINYWRDRVMDTSVAKKMVEHMTEKELTALLALWKRIADIDAFNNKVDMPYLEKFMILTELMLEARFERRLTYLRAQPQLLLEAKAELRAKRSKVKATDTPAE
jgi:hypothetical protein